MAKAMNGETRGVQARLPLTNREKDVVRALACVMWADGHAAPAERKLIEHVIAGFDPNEEEWREMMSWLSEDVAAVSGVEIERMTDEQREVLMTDAVLVSYA